MELEFKPAKFALNRNSLETVVVKEVNGDDIVIISIDGSMEKTVQKKDYNLFKRKNGKWTVEGPPIYREENEIANEMSERKGNNISERFKR